MRIWIPVPNSRIPVSVLPDKRLFKRAGLIFFIFTCLAAPAGAISQKLSMHVKNVQIERVLKILQKRSGYQFIYNNELLSTAAPVSLNITNGTLKDILEATFRNQPLTYEVVEETIVIKRKPG